MMGIRKTKMENYVNQFIPIQKRFTVFQDVSQSY